MRYALALIAVAALTACGKPPRDSRAQAEARIALFKQCMELAAKMPRQADDDVSNIVQECSSQSYYMTLHVGAKP